MTSTIRQEQAKTQIRQLIEQYRALSDSDRRLVTEASVVRQFIDPLLEALGWPIRDPARYKYELATQAGRPDMTLIPEQGGVIFVEAKRFGAIQELAQARRTISGIVTPGQLALPGMATDRTPQEQQAINYAFQNGGTWAILTNFEKLRLFNARRDWLVLSFENPNAYLDEFELLWQLSYESVINSRLDLLSDQRHREDVDTAYLSFINEWREKLAQDLIARSAENPWAFTAEGQVNLAELRAVVQRVLDRLVVVRFAEDHLIAPVGTLFSFYEMRQRNPYTFTLSEFFGRLYRRFDELHNSALFAPSLADQAVFSDEVLGGLIQKLYEARYRAMSADIIGNTYEQYLGKTLIQANGQVKTADNLETRKKQGSYYTPQVIVRYLVDNSLGRYLYGTTNGQPSGEPLPGEVRKTALEIRELRVLDPACGSGSFLIYAYQILADFYRSEIKRLQGVYQAKLQECIQRGLSPMEMEFEIAPLRAEISYLEDYPRLILENHLYGVDLDPQAAEIATVNLIMRAMADQSGRKRRLPLILNQNVKVGNALIGAGLADPRYAAHTADLAELRRLRRKLPTEIESSDHRETLAAIAEIEGRVNEALNEGLGRYLPTPEQHRPFHWVVGFPEAFLDKQGQPKGETAGFQVIIGNPPWEIVKPDLREYYAQFDPEIESRLTREGVERRIRELEAEDPNRVAGWGAQKARIDAEASYYKASSDFTRQGGGDTATHKLFLERAYNLLAHDGRLGFVIPSGIYSDLGTKPLREMLLNEGQIEYLYNFSNERFFFPHVDHRVKFTLLGAKKRFTNDGFWATFRFNPRVAVAPDDLPSFLANSSNLIYIRRESLTRFSPDSLSIMEFQTQRDYKIVEIFYDENPLLGDELANTWNIRFTTEFHITNDRRLFNSNGKGLPLYQGRMIHQYDSFYAQPSIWIEEDLVRSRYERNSVQGEVLEYLQPRLAFRGVARSTDNRTLIAAMLPPRIFAEIQLPVADNRRAKISLSEQLFLLGIFNSFCMDWIIRLKVGARLSNFYMYQLPLPRLTAGNPYFDAIVPRTARLTCTAVEFADLWQKVMSEAWDETKGVTDPGQRQILRDELDALVAHLYGLSRTEFEHILGTFPLVFPPSAEGQVRKERLLSVYEQFGEVTREWVRK